LRYQYVASGSDGPCLALLASQQRAEPFCRLPILVFTHCGGCFAREKLCPGHMYLTPRARWCLLKGRRLRRKIYKRLPPLMKIQTLLQRSASKIGCHALIAPRASAFQMASVSFSSPLGGRLLGRIAPPPLSGPVARLLLHCPYCPPRRLRRSPRRLWKASAASAASAGVVTSAAGEHRGDQELSPALAAFRDGAPHGVLCYASLPTQHDFA
jgi:hypothetical protein